MNEKDSVSVGEASDTDSANIAEKDSSRKKSVQQKSNSSTKQSSTKRISSSTSKSAGKARSDKERKPVKKGSPAKKKTAIGSSNNAAFTSLPDSLEGFDEIETNLDVDEEKQLESDAIAALPRAESLDDILFNFEENEDTHETPEEALKYESFLADYKVTIAAMLAEAQEKSEGEAGIGTTSNDEADNYETSDDEDAPLLLKQKGIDSFVSDAHKSQEEAISLSVAEEAVHNMQGYELSESVSEAVSENHTEAEQESTPDKIGGEPNESAYEIDENASETEGGSVENTENIDDTSPEELVQMVIDFGEIAEELTHENESEQPDFTEPLPAEDDEEPKYNPEKPRRIDNIFDVVELLVFTLVAVFVITSFFFRHSIVDGGSMENTLKDGEHLILSHAFYTPERGDIVVFEDHEAGVTTPYIKRIIGLAGDTVHVSSSGAVYVNGEQITEDYVHPDGPGLKPTGTFTVGEGQVFVMGDHRSVSEDSRSFGAINEDSILGKVILRFYPFSEFGTVD